MTRSYRTMKTAWQRWPKALTRKAVRPRRMETLSALPGPHAGPAIGLSSPATRDMLQIFRVAARLNAAQTFGMNAIRIGSVVKISCAAGKPSARDARRQAVGHRIHFKAYFFEAQLAQFRLRFRHFHSGLRRFR